MKRFLVSTVVTLALFAAIPAFAEVTSAPVPATGIAPEEMAQLMSQHGWPAQIAKDSDGNPLIKSNVAGVGFDVAFFECHGGRCRDIRFEVGWSKAGPPNVTPEKLNTWNTNNRFLRAYLRPDRSLWAAMDARIARGTTANVEEYIVLWPATLKEFRSYFGL